MTFPKGDIRNPEDFEAMAKLVRPENYKNRVLISPTWTSTSPTSSTSSTSASARSTSTTSAATRKPSSRPTDGRRPEAALAVVVEAQTRNPRKVAMVPGHQRQAVDDRGRGDEEIEVGDEAACAPEVGYP